MAAAQEGERALERAEASLTAGDLDGVVAQLSAAIRAFTAEGRPGPAAMACARLGDVYANFLGNLAAARAWFARGRRLVADEPPCIEQGWVAVAAMGCEVDDPDELLAAAELALDRARRFGDVNLETKALADAGLAHVQSGRLDEGMALLDEAMALACGPADDPDTTAKSVCSFFTACYHAADFGRAGTWAELFRRQGLIARARGGPVFLSSHCDSVQATSLLELGRWSEAEDLLERARADFTEVMQAPAWHPDIALADLRIRQGRLADAEALLLGKDQSLQALLPASRLHLVRGEHDLARAAGRRALRALAGDRLRAVELLTVLVEVEVASGDLAAATAHCEDLVARLDGVEVPVLHGRAALARAAVLLAAGQPGDAVVVLEEALDRVRDEVVPWLQVTLLLALAGAREQAGDPAAAALDAKAAAALVSGLDVVLDPAATALLDRLAPGAWVRPGAGPAGPGGSDDAVATLAVEGRWCTVTAGATTARLPVTKGLRYLAELVARPGHEQHALDLVDRIEGLVAGGLDPRRLGDAGPLLDARARAAYRRHIEELRAEADDALAEGRWEAAEAAAEEVDQLVQQLARAFGLGGRSRTAASAAERARLNVTRALRTAVARLQEAVPEAGAVLDRRLRTGLYCTFEPAADDPFRWIVQS